MFVSAQLQYCADKFDYFTKKKKKKKRLNGNRSVALIIKGQLLSGCRTKPEPEP